MRALGVVLILGLLATNVAAQTLTGEAAARAELIKAQAEILELQKQLTELRLQALQADAAKFVEALRVQLKASPKATFNWQLLAFVEPAPEKE